MMTRQAKKISCKTISLLVVITMLVTMILPMTTFAATPTVSGTGVILNGDTTDGATAGDTIAITFDDKVDFDNANWETDITVDNAGIPGSFGDNASISLDVNKKVLSITLSGNGINITESSTIVFANSVILDNATKTDAFVGSVSLLGSFSPATVDADFSATAICSDVASKDGKANKIVLVFDRATNGDQGYKNQAPGYQTFLSALSLAGIGNSTGVWDATNTIYTITLGSTANIANNAQISFARDNNLTDANGAYIKSIASKTIAGNFVGAGALTVATTMIATIVKTTITPLAQQGDKIIVVFNAPTNGTLSTPNIIDTLSTKFGVGATGIWSAEGTIYTITIGTGAAITETDKISYTVGAGLKNKSANLDVEDISPIALTGTFGVVIKPEVLGSIAISTTNKATAFENDIIRIVFNSVVNKTSVTNVTATNGTFGTGFSYANNVSWNDTTLAYDKVSIMTIKLGTTPIINVGSTVISIVGTIKDLTGKETCDNAGYILVNSGSFGTSITPELMSATIVKASVKAGAQQNDKVVLFFNAPTNGSSDTPNLINTFGTGLFGTAASGEWSNQGTLYTIRLGLGATITDTTKLVLPALSGVKDIYGVKDAPKSVNISLGGTFGIEQIQIPKVSSVIAYSENGNHYIKAVFNMATNLKDIALDGNFIASLMTNNNKLGTVVSVSTDATSKELIILLPDDATVKYDEVLSLIGLGIKSQNGGDLDTTDTTTSKIKGYLVPVVETVTARAGNKIEIKFSAKTNGVANISGLTSLLGVGVTTSWDSKNTTLTITLGTNYTITDRGYITLTGMGIKDDFSKSYSIVGQYKITDGSFEADAVQLKSIIANSVKTDVETAQVGDTIKLTFSRPIDTTNKDTIITKVMSGATEVPVADAFGAGATFTLTNNNTTLVVTLGTNPKTLVGDKITVSNVESYDKIAEYKLTSKEDELLGSFDGRDFAINKGSITVANNNNFQIKATVVNVNETSKTPTIVCVAFSGNAAVSITRITIDVANRVTPIFEVAPSLNVTSAKIYVFSDMTADIAANPEVLAKTLEIIK